MTTPREKFQALLKKLFQFDNAELDFGIYRIMNQKRAVIERFIEKDLIEGLDKELKRGAHAEQADLARQLTEATARIRENFGDDALDAEGKLLKGQDLPLGKDYEALRARAAGAKSSPELEAEIFNHLYAFFSRYYDDGDFMSLRRYSRRDKYAIPYNGEEVHLHWANADQYYIKTGENFTDYSYKHGGWTVRFKLRNADVEQNNVKGAKRFFIPRPGDIELDAKTKTLSIPFEYRPLGADEEIRYGKGSAENGAAEGGNGKGKPKKKKGQEGILADATSAIQQSAKKTPDALVALLHEKRKDADGETVTLLDHHLRAYTRSNTTDFFIHKDLKGFLERELDFYLKNEVLNLDELEAGGESRSENWFQTLRTIKAIGRQIIAFVAQIENFQKRLFEKKKFVTEVNYCVTLDRVPDELYPEIVRNKAQIADWKQLFHVDKIKGDMATTAFKEPVKVDFLKAHQFLVVDTKHFDEAFVTQLLAAQRNIEAWTEGLLVCSENFHALTLLNRVLMRAIDVVYIDPPYNTSEFGFVYKNEYKHSSWLAMIENRVRLVHGTMPREGVIGVAIDDTEAPALRLVLDRIFGSANFISTIAVEVNPAGQNIRPNVPARSHDYCMFYAKDASAAELLIRELTEEEKAAYSEKDLKGQFLWDNLRRRGGNSRPGDRPNQWYPLYANVDSGKVSVEPFRGGKEFWPIDPQGEKRIWRVSPEGARREIAAGEVSVTMKAGRVEIIKKSRMPKGKKPKTLWAAPEYSATTY
ncbi:MAG: DNA methyltransferase, partial [Burkholderiales bacterium]